MPENFPKTIDDLDSILRTTVSISMITALLLKCTLSDLSASSKIILLRGKEADAYITDTVVVDFLQTADKEQRIALEESLTIQGKLHGLVFRLFRSGSDEMHTSDIAHTLGIKLDPDPDSLFINFPEVITRNEEEDVVEAVSEKLLSMAKAA